MVFSFKEYFFGSRTFCCCLPVRAGVIIMSALGFLLSGLLAVVLWYELAVGTSDLTSSEKAAFVISGVFETLLFIASVLGFIGAVVRKQRFIDIYRYFVYVHFFLNLGLAAWLLWEVNHVTLDDANAACNNNAFSQQAQEQCVGFLKVARGVYYAITALVVLAELYGILIVTRYANQLRSEKRMYSAGLVNGPAGYKMDARGSYARLSGDRGLPSARSLGGSNSSYYATNERDFDPYDEDIEALELHAKSSSHDPTTEGYGGGSWTHSDISEQEKSRLRDAMEEEEDGYRPTVLYTDPFDHSDKKSPVPPAAPMQDASNQPPKYTDYRA